jgi:VWFA-related protein
VQRSHLILYFVAALAPVFAQQDAPSRPSAQGPVLRITVNLVQVDAVVTDSKGRQVTDLKADDFEILEDGRPQKITAFSYVATVATASPSVSVRAKETSPGAPAPPPVRLKPEQVRRTIVLLVDDLGLSFESTAYVRRALKKFVDEQMQDGDLVAIMRTRAGMGALQQFTADKRILYAAIEHTRWYPLGRGGIGAFAPLGSDPIERARVQRPGSPGRQPQTDRAETFREQQTFEEARDENFMIGTLGAVNFVLRGVRDLPGRKAVILFSDGVPLFLRGQSRSRIVDAMRRLTDLANRSAVLIYTVDARGLQTLSLTAADDPYLDSGAATELSDALSGRHQEYFESQAGLDYLAQQTGGFFIHDSNDLNWGIRRVLDDLSGYYLIGYKPEESDFQAEGGRRPFHKIHVKVKGKGLHVRSRTGYFGIPDEESRPVYHTRLEQLGAALTSPFSSAELKLRLTCLFSEVPKTGAVVRALLHIDARDLTYTQEPGGGSTAILDVAAFAFGEQGAVVDSSDRTFTIKLSDDQRQVSLKSGFLYTLDVPLRKPGAYQMRIAVRDATSGRVGSASQFVEVPDVRQHRLALSGIILNGARPKDAGAVAGQPEEQYGIAGAGTPAVRVFRPGETISYAYVIFNARVDGKSGRTDLETQLSLYRDSRLILAGPLTTFAAQEKTDVSRLVGSGALRLGAKFEPGEYVVQVIARDKLASKKRCMASQWIDLEIVP